MDYIYSIGHLFDFAASGRKLSQRKTAPADPSGTPVPPASSIAGEQAGIYLRGLLEAKAGDRNFEDSAETVPGADHQRVQHFMCDAPWEASKVLDWVSRQADAVLGGTPLSHLIVDESGFSKKGKFSGSSRNLVVENTRRHRGCNWGSPPAGLRVAEFPSAPLRARRNPA